MPAAAHTEKDGTFTNTQRLLQWHEKAVEPRGDARSELVHVPPRRRLPRAGGSTDPRDGALLDLTWDYPTDGPTGADAEAILREINGYAPDGPLRR